VAGTKACSVSFFFEIFVGSFSFEIFVGSFSFEILAVGLVQDSISPKQQYGDFGH
jgi:hypothetical protein